MPRFLVFGDDNVDALRPFLSTSVFHLETHNGITADLVVCTMMWEVEAMLNEDEKYDAVVVILGINDLSNLSKINELVRRYSPQCLFVDLHSNPMPTQLPTIPVNLHPEWHFEPNGIHLNSRGARLVATNIRWKLHFIIL